MFEAVTTHSVSDVVFDQLRDRIVNRDLDVGEELPAERILGELLGVSRNAVREAIKRLQQAGLVQVRHGGATTVLDYRAEAGPDLLPSLLVDRAGRIQVDVARSIVRMRQVLSPEIAAEAAAHGGEELCARLDTIVEAMRVATDSASRQQLAFAFWAALVEGSGNIAYQLAFNSLRKTYQPIWDLLTRVLDAEVSDLPSFERLAGAVRSGCRQTAFDRARIYIDASSAAINRFLDALDPQGGAGRER